MIMDKIVVFSILRFLVFMTIVLTLAWCYGAYFNQGKSASVWLALVVVFLSKWYFAYDNRRIEKERRRLKNE